MKLLIDRCISHRVAQELRGDGHETESVLTWPSDPGDVEILRIAAAAGQVLITIDRGFGELAVRFGLPNAGIIVLENIPARDHVAECRRAIAEHADVLIACGIVLVKPKKMRPRWPPQDA